MNEYIAENNRIAFVHYTHEDDCDMFACWQDRDTQKGYNYAFDGSLVNLSSIDITAFPFWVVVVDKDNGAKIGVLRLSSGAEQDLAIWIYPNYRGMGYGTEAFSLAVDYIFRNMNLRKIYAGCYCDNKASLRTLEKVGFVRYPAGDQQEENCFTGEPTTQLSFVKTNAVNTKDLILRQGAADDWRDLYRNLWSHEEVFQYMFKNPCPSEEHAAARTGAYAVMHEEVKTEFFAIEKASRQAIGIAGIKELKPGKWTVTDIALGPHFQGKGYGKQIVTALLNLAYELGATEVAYDCFTQNAASKQLALSCGFTYSHSEEAELMKNGEKVILDYYIHKRK